MNNKPMVVLAGTLMLLPVRAGAQTLITLGDAVMLALRHDSRVLEAEANEDRARRAADVSRAAFGPNLFTGTGAVYTYGFPQTPGGAAPSVFNLAFTQTLFDGPAKGQQRAASNRIEVQRVETARVRDATILEAALAYLELAAVRQALERQRTARRSAEDMIGSMTERLQEGRVLPVNVLEARLSSARLVQRITQLEGREATLENQILLEALPYLPAEKIYERQWALTLLDQVFARLREECAAAGKAQLFEALRMYLSGEKSTESYAEVAPRLNMTAGSVQVAVHRLRRRYGELLRAEIAHTVSRPEEIDEEIRHLFAALRV